MALGTREVLVVVRARDVATRTLNNIGGAMGTLGDNANEANNALFRTGAAITSIGIAMGVAGAAILGFGNESVNTFIEYEEEAASALTQTRGLGISLDDLLDLGRRVGRELPVPFEEIQPTLFDIFSTLDTLNLSLEDTEMILRGFAKAAVAGNVEMREASRATMAIMNAFGLEASDVNRVLDIQFQMVKSGTGTYGEFATTIGLAISAFSTADQSVESLAGSVAFLTKQGLSASRSATSAARAMELIAKPDSVANLEDLGVAVRDADGNFNDLQTIMNDLAFSAGWEAMTGPERAAAFKETFGTGTRQARRFFDSVIPNMDSYNTVMDSMHDSTGAMEEAFAIMGDTGAAKAQLLSNQYEILKTEIGQELLPAKIRLMEAAMELFEWWSNLDDSTKKLIIRIGAAVGVFLTLFGIILTLVGGFMIFAAVVGGVIVAVKLLVIIGAIAGAIAAAGFLIVTNWEKIKPVLEDVWMAVTDAAQVAWDKLREFFGWLQDTFGPVVEEVFGLIGDVAESAWGALTDAGDTVQPKLEEFRDWFENTFAPAFEEVWGNMGAAVEDGAGVAQEKLAEFRAWLDSDFGPAVSEALTDTGNAAADAWDTVSDATETARDILEGLGEWLQGTLEPIINETFVVIKREGSEVWDGLSRATEVIRTNLEDFKALVTETIWPGILEVWNTAKDEIGKITDEISKFIDEPGPVIENLADVVRTNWEVIATVIKTVVGILSEVIQFFIKLVTSAWERFGPTIVNLVKIAWNNILNMITTVIEIISGIIRTVLAVIRGDWESAWEAIKDVAASIWDFIWTAVENGIALVLELFFNFLPNLLEFFADASDWLFEAGGNIILGLLLGLLEALTHIWNFVWDFFDSFITTIKNAFGIESPASKLVPIGIDIILGVLKGLKDAIPFVLGWLGELPGKAINAVGDVTRTLYNKGKDLLDGLRTGARFLWDNHVKPWLNNLPGNISSAIGSLRSLLTNKGRDTLRGLRSGFLAYWNGTVRPWWDNLPTSITNAIGNVGDVLLDIGRDIIQGLWDGMQSVWDDVTSWLSGLGPSMPDWKGPPSKDKTLLTENGHLIMDGFLKGLQDGWVDVIKFLTMATGEMGMFGSDLGDVIMEGPMSEVRRGGFRPEGGDGDDRRPRIGVNIENAQFGDERVVEDLDWWTKTTGAGV